MMRSYSSAVRPWLWARSSVTLGSPAVTPPPPGCHVALPLEERAVFDEGAENRVEDEGAVGPAHRGLGGPLRVRHQPEHRAFLVDHAGDIVERTVGVGFLGDAPIFRAVPEDDLVLRPEPPQGLRVGVVLPLAVRDGHLENLALPQRTGERGVRVLDQEVGRLAAVLQALVAHQGTGQQPGLAEDLEPVARAEHEAAAGGELGQRLHHRRTSRHRARPEIVPVREATGEDQAVELAEVGVPVPDITHRLMQDFADDVVKVAVTPRAREDHHAKVHGTVCSSLCGYTVTLTCHPRSDKGIKQPGRRLPLPLTTGSPSFKFARLAFGCASPSYCPRSAEEFDAEILDYWVAEEAGAHLVYSTPRVFGSEAVQLDVH